MVKISADMIQQCAQYTNPVREREIDMRGYKISVIENLGATLDQFESIDLSDNDLRKLEGFPLLRRLKTLILNNNRICRFEENLQDQLPELDTVILTNNSVSELVDLDNLASIKTLKHLSLLRNPCTKKPNYRLYAIYKLPQLRVLDFVRIKQKDRDAAKAFFTGKGSEQLRREIDSKRRKPSITKVPAQVQKQPSSAEEQKRMESIKVAITKAKTLDEVQRLEQMLKHGQLLTEDATSGQHQNGSSIEEHDE